MLYEAVWEDREKPRANPTKGWMLVTLSVAVSIDALAVGLTMAFLGVPILMPCIVIGVVAAVFSAAGITFGHRLARRWGQAAEVLGGLVLIGIGVRVLVSHLS